MCDRRCDSKSVLKPLIMGFFIGEKVILNNKNLGDEYVKKRFGQYDYLIVEKILPGGIYQIRTENFNMITPIHGDHLLPYNDKCEKVFKGVDFSYSIEPEVEYCPVCENNGSITGDPCGHCKRVW